MIDRAAIICGYLGKPWRANAAGPDAFDCWHLIVAASKALFGRELPAVAVPDVPSWAWLMRTIEGHPERQKWRYVAPDSMGLIKAGDGSVVLMARRDRPAHIGLWLAPERIVMHADPNHGVVCDPPVELSVKGWARLRFYEPALTVNTV